jgi:protease IV
MNLSPDLLYERNKMRTQLHKWKWLFFLIVILLVFVVNGSVKKNKGQDYIARLRIEGLIYSDVDLIDKINEIKDNPKVKAVILHINSPGGTSFAGEELYINLKRLSEKKPVVSVLGTVAASGGYMVALGTDYIVARNMTVTGSIGVIWQSFEAVEMANKLGIKFVSLKSSPLKAAPNPTELMTSEAKAAAMETVEDSYKIFLGMLIENRKISPEKARKLADGRIYTGMRAKEVNLIDAIGGEEEALSWLETKKDIPAILKVEDVSWNEPDGLLKQLTQFMRNSNKILTGMFTNTTMAIK